MDQNITQPINPAQSRKDYWKEKVSQFQKSGLSQSEFCRQHGLKLSSLNYWYHSFPNSRQETKKGTKNTSPNFIGIKPNSLPSSSPMTLSFPNGLQLSWHGECDIKFLSSLIKEINP